MKVFNLGLIDFKDALQFQKDTFCQVKNKALESALIICRHYPVITLGRQADKKNILVNEDALRLRGIPVYNIERGGDATYHGPGQITVYPIFNLNYFKKDVHLFLRQLESVVIELLSDFGITGLRNRGFTGVWVGRKKIASIGVAIKNWITFHGLSLNTGDNDLVNFRLIRPCGMDVEMTSLEMLLGRKIEAGSIEDKIARKFEEVFLPNNKEAVLL